MIELILVLIGVFLWAVWPRKPGDPVTYGLLAIVFGVLSFFGFALAFS